MTVRSLSCPKCGKNVNVLAAMQSIRCPGCGNVFSASGNAAESAPSRQGKSLQDAGKSNRNEPDHSSKNDSTLLLIAVCGGLALVLLLCAVGIWTLTGGDDATDNVSSEDLKPVLHEATDEELAALTIADVPEKQRRQIYDDVRTSAQTSSEKALLVPEGKVRMKLENMLDATHENTLRQLAALNDITVEDVRKIIIEGDLKNWDPRARSRAYRGGQRLYEDERTQGHREKNLLP